MKHIGLFEGIGGFSLAARWMGWETLAWCEWNEYCQKILKQHFKQAQGYGDITKTDFTIYRGQCDIVTGGFPCQPYSLAGKRKGKEDERHLWPEMLRAIREIQPRWIIGENVYGIINWGRGMVVNEIKTDLENEGYKLLPPIVLPACAVGGYHKRDRTWFIAYSDSGMLQNEKIQPYKSERIHKKTSGQSNNTNSREVVSKIWQGVYDEPNFLRDDDGLPHWVDRVKALGNSIVPQVAYQLYRVIALMEENKNPRQLSQGDK